MSSTSSKSVLLGVTGSIAAYKACDIASQLVKAGYRVTAALTESAQRFVGAASFEGITHNRAIVQLFEPDQNAAIDHVELAKAVDLFLVAPASANSIAKAALGLADDWISSAMLATTAPVLFAPAMNTNMYEHPATQANLATLLKRGCHFVGPDSGVLACNTIGRGRMMEPDVVVAAARMLLETARDLAGKRILITSGANHEPIDPVRFIGNRSSGKMGHAIAAEALRRGAKVTVVTGPAQVDPPAGAEIVRVQTAIEMRDAVLARLADSDVVIGAAAVADYRVENPAGAKQKRNGQGLTLKLVENPDIIAEVGKARKNGTMVIGFAAETDDLLKNAKSKLEKKSLDLIVANEVGGENSAFGSDHAKAAFLHKDGTIEELPLAEKPAIAKRLMDFIAASSN